MMVFISLSNMSICCLYYPSPSRTTEASYCDKTIRHTYWKSDMHSRAWGVRGDLERDQEGQCGAGLRKNN